MKNEMLLSKGVKIVKAEAKDLIGGEFSLLNNNNELTLFKFYGNLDYSLGLIKLYKLVGGELYKEIDGKLYSDIIINVGFKYKAEEHTDAEEESLQKFYEEKNKIYKKYEPLLEGKYNKVRETKDRVLADKYAEINRVKQPINREKEKELTVIEEYKELTKLRNKKGRITSKAKKEERELTAEELIIVKELQNEITKLNNIVKNDERFLEIKARYSNIIKNNEEITKLKEEIDYIVKNNEEIANCKAEVNRVKEQRAAEVNKLEEKVLRGSLALRAELYKNGFDVDGKHYVRFLRSAGSAKAGNCLFIQQEYYKPMLEWLLAGLDVKEDEQLNDKLPQIEAYMALAFSSLTDTIDIPKESILLVNDVKSVFSDIASVTSLVNGELVTENKELTIKNSLFDGSSLIDMDFIPMEYRIAGGFQARNRWFKGYLFGSNIQQFFKDNGITEVSQLNGKTLATDVKQIKLITTKSSIKYMKFGSFEQWLENIDTTFGIGLVAHSSKFLGGEYIQTHYQLINNLQMNKAEVEKLAEDTIEYIKNLKNCLPMFLKHAGQIGEIEEDEQLEVKINKHSLREDFFINLAKVNKNFANTRVFKNYRKQMIKNFVDNAKHGRLLIKGCYAVVIANSYEYLLHSIGRLVNKDGSLNANMEKEEMMCDFFDYDREYVCSRSPMPVQGNILLSSNKDNQNIRKYFSYTDENGNKVMPKFIMHRNVINENCMEKASGFDK